MYLDVDYLHRLYASRQHQSSSFQSKTIRDPYKPLADKDNPGPGLYLSPQLVTTNQQLCM